MLRDPVRRLALILLTGVVALAAGSAAAAPPRPKLVVAISVDQFALDLYQRYAATFTGGLKRLGGGLAFEGYQSHAATETCPGHSTILTGDHPARTGIVANSWFVRETGSTVYCVSVLGTADPNARGPQLLRVDAFGDWLQAAQPGARAIAVSGKDRAAIMMAGQHPTAVYWWNDGEGFATSSYAGPTSDHILALARDFDRETYAAWTKTPPHLWPTALPARCVALQKPYEIGKWSMSGKVPTDTALDVERGAGYVATGAFNDELRASPIFDPLALAFATRVIDDFKLGAGPATDLLAVSLSSTDHIGHRYGNGGAETCVHLAVLDQALGAFFDRLDGLKVPYVVVLTADHGAVDIPERLGPPARRLDIAALIGGLNGHLRSRFNLGYDAVAGDDPRQIIISLAPNDNLQRAVVLSDTLAWLQARPEVKAAFSADEIAAAVPPPGKSVKDLTLAERFHESFDRERSGDILVAYAEGATLGSVLSSGATVAGHGSPWDYDRRVPILWWWPGVAPTAETQPMETVDIAPTLAAIVGVKAPPVDGHCVDLGQGCRK